MNNVRRFIILIFAITFFTAAQCQVSGSFRKWSIGDCIQYAGDHNLQINTLRLNEQSGQQDLLAAKGAKIPSLAGSVSNTFNDAWNNAGVNGGLVNQLATSGNYSVNSSVVLWNDHYINNNIRQQGLLIRSAGLSVQETQNNITLSITQAFLNILLAKENEKYVVDLVNTSDSSVRQGQMLYDAGSIAKVGLLQLQAQLAGNKYLLVQTQNAIRQNILTLKQILQLPADSAFDIEAPESVEPFSTMPSLLEAEHAALQNFPEIKIGKLGLDIADLDITMAQAGFKPTLRATGSLGTGYRSILTNNYSSKSGYFKQAGNNLNESVGLTLSIPIFSQWVNKTNLEKARINYKAADLNFQNYQLVLTQAVEQAYLSAINAKHSLEAAKQQLVFVSESYRIANEQLKLGAINAYDLLLQQNQYIQAVQAYTQAKYSAVLQQKIFEFYTGKPVSL